VEEVEEEELLRISGEIIVTVEISRMEAAEGEQEVSAIFGLKADLAERAGSWTVRKGR
jgi:hypothetical protein